MTDDPPQRPPSKPPRTGSVIPEEVMREALGEHGRELGALRGQLEKAMANLLELSVEVAGLKTRVEGLERLVTVEVDED